MSVRNNHRREIEEFKSKEHQKNKNNGKFNTLKIIN